MERLGVNLQMMANFEDEDVIEDDHFSAVLNFPPEVQEAIDQVLAQYMSN